MILADLQTSMFAAITGVAPVEDERLLIYQRAYRTRLIDTLRAMFPTLLDTTGEELFHQFAIDFILRDPPRGWTLERLAETFPRYLAETKPDEPWAERLVEIAQRDARRRARRFGLVSESAPHPAVSHPLPALAGRGAT